MSTLQLGRTNVSPAKSQKKRERKHQVKSLIKPYHQEEEEEERSKFKPCQ
jgi:hypothetical protein